jgi:uncharacterized membrane protein YhaH (DUF805 family)
VNGNELALRPLRHFADFSGRSTRGELFYFGILIAVIGIPVAAVDLVLSPRSSAWIMLGIIALLACPIFAMFVRRVHDVGWRGWWIAPLAPAMAIGWWNELQRLQHPLVYPPPRLLLPQTVELGGSILVFAAIVLLLWDDEQAPNRFGPNPRTGPVGEPA